jgi:hypothetical protein
MNRWQLVEPAGMRLRIPKGLGEMGAEQVYAVPRDVCWTTAWPWAQAYANYQMEKAFEAIIPHSAWSGSCSNVMARRGGRGDDGDGPRPDPGPPN